MIRTCVLSPICTPNVSTGKIVILWLFCTLYLGLQTRLVWANTLHPPIRRRISHATKGQLRHHERLNEVTTPIPFFYREPLSSTSSQSSSLSSSLEVLLSEIFLQATSQRKLQTNKNTTPGTTPKSSPVTQAPTKTPTFEDISVPPTLVPTSMVRPPLGIPTMAPTITDSSTPHPEVSTNPPTNANIVTLPTILPPATTQSPSIRPLLLPTTEPSVVPSLISDNENKEETFTGIEHPLNEKMVLFAVSLSATFALVIAVSLLFRRHRLVERKKQQQEVEN